MNMASSATSTSLLFSLAAALMINSAWAQTNSGFATYSNIGTGVCPGGSNGLPGVSMNAAQFEGGSTCGQCIQIQGTGNGAGANPVSTAPFIATITNVCSECNYGDIDLQESGDGQFAVTWSFVACPGAGRRLIEDDVTAAAAAEEHDSRAQETADAAVSADAAASADAAEGEEAAADTVASELAASLEAASDTPANSLHQAETELPQEPQTPAAASPMVQATSRKLLRAN